MAWVLDQSNSLFIPTQSFEDTAAMYQDALGP